MPITRQVLGWGIVLGLLTLAGARSEPDSATSPAAPRSASANLTSEARQLQLKACLVSLIQDVEVPAREAGQITKVEVREGQEVASGQAIAQIDDERAKAQRQAAEGQLQHAK